jgi:hypothetical protein
MLKVLLIAILIFVDLGCRIIVSASSKDLFHRNDYNSTDERRRLSAKFDIRTGEAWGTYDGEIPEVNCPPG